MRVKLSHEDRCAIDVVLENRTGEPVSPHCFGKPTAALQRRIKGVEKLCDLIAQAPAEDPSEKLVAMTMKFIRRNDHALPIINEGAVKGQTLSYAMTQRPLQ